MLLPIAREAFAILVRDLESRGNVLSGMHRAALAELVDTFAEYLNGSQAGRRAFGLPTGLGKTSAVVAFLTAMHRQGCTLPVSVAASKVEALCSIKRDLLDHGVPEELVGIKHGKALGEATYPSTGNESRQFQLVTHYRVRSGRDFDLFGEHHGQRRPLCIYDESLLRSDTFAFSEKAVRQALGVLRIELEGRADPLTVSLLAYLDSCAGLIADALERLRSSPDEHRNGMPVELPWLEETELTAYRAAVIAAGGRLRGWAVDLESLLSVSQESLQVLTAEQGGGVIAIREVVPAALRNVVILDASTAIRELVHLDPTIFVEQSFAAEDLKSYENVQVYQLLASGGRGAIEGGFSAKAREARAVSAEVIDIIHEREHVPGSVLLFSFLPRRGQVDVLAELRGDLSRAGIDLTATTADGKPRFEFRTWGSESGENGLEHCSTVIMAGVLHRSHLDIAAAVKGQVGHLAEPTPSDRLRRIIESEVAHVVMQGASRGSCRRIINGKASAMALYVIHRDPGLKTILDRAMPAALWSYPEPRHLKKAAGEGRAAHLFGQLIVYLQGLNEGTDRVSSKVAKAALSLDKDNATRLAFGRATELLDPDLHGWVSEGRSFVRHSHGFVDHSRD